MWPFRRKTPPPEPAPQPAGQPPPQPPAAAPAANGGATKTADDVLRQLEAESKAKAQAQAQALAPAAPAAPEDPNLGHCLLAEGPITREFLDQQLALAGKRDSFLGKLLAATQAPAEASLLALLANGYQVPEVDLKQCRVHVPTARSIPRETALKYKTVPIERVGDIVCAVFSGEPNPKAAEAIRRETGARVKMLRCPTHHLQILLRRVYATPAAAPAPTQPAVAAEPISKQQYDQAAHRPAARAEARWDALYASKGPIRAARFGRR